MSLTVGIEHWPLARPFGISRGSRTETVTVVTLISDGEYVGRGEATPYQRYGETPDGVAALAATMRGVLDGPDAQAGDPAERRRRLGEALPAGAARNALDCALWDLEAKRTGRRVADLAGLSPPTDVATAVTLSLGAPEQMAGAAREAVRDHQAGLLKVKLGAGDAADEAARLTAIRAAAPGAALIVDANEGWDLERLRTLDGPCAEAGALFIEQPVPAAQDAALQGLALRTRLCADESVHGVDDLPRLAGRYQVVNIKLDKTGGLTAAIGLRDAARAQGFEVMIGCMVAGSLAMAPAFLLTDGALAVDLDGPLLLARDREPAIHYAGARMQAPPAELWG